MKLLMVSKNEADAKVAFEAMKEPSIKGVLDRLFEMLDSRHGEVRLHAADMIAQIVGARKKRGLSTLLSMLLVAGGALFAESGPTRTEVYHPTAWGPSLTASGPVTCALGPAFEPVVGRANPLCSISQGASVKYAALDFPPGKLTCTAVRVLVPNELDLGDVLDLSRALTVRFSYTRSGGGTGSSIGGVCTGECAVMYARVASQLDFGIFGSPTYSAPFVSDFLPNGGPAFPGKKITAAVRGISIADITPRNPLVIELCRDARASNTQDTSKGTLRMVDPLSVIWPTVQSVAPARQ